MVRLTELRKIEGGAGEAHWQEIAEVVPHAHDAAGAVSAAFENRHAGDLRTAALYLRSAADELLHHLEHR